MELTGRIDTVTKDVLTGRERVTFICNPFPLQGLEKYAEKPLSISVKEYSKKRSLNANAYYWTLVNALAAALKISNAAMHNMLLRRYGVPEVIGGKLCYVTMPDTVEAEKRSLEAETYHVKPTSDVRVGIDGTFWRTYVMLKGSKNYDTKEMTRLIDGVISECRELGIETIAPDQLERMMQSYERV